MKSYSDLFAKTNTGEQYKELWSHQYAKKASLLYCKIKEQRKLYCNIKEQRKGASKRKVNELISLGAPEETYSI